MFKKPLKMLLVIPLLAVGGLIALTACTGASAGTATPLSSGAPAAVTTGGVNSLPQGSGVVPQKDVAGTSYLAQIVPVPTNQQAGIWVNGTGSIRATPDTAILSLGVQARGATVAEANSKAATAMDAVMKVLTTSGVASKDIQTTNYSIQPVYTYNQITRNGVVQSQQVLIGYDVTNTVTAKIRNLNNVGKTIDEAAAAGGDVARIQGISFTIDNPKPLESQARDLAMKDALTKAQQLAAGAGVTLGKATYVSESSYTPIYQEVAVKSLARDGAAAAPTTPISAGQSEVVINVQVVFSIQ